MNDAFDVLVLGGGAAGCAAALAAAAAGARVGLVRPAPGASGLGSGGWRGPVPGGLGAALEAAGHPLVPAPGPLPHPFGDLRSYERAGASHASAVVGEGTVVAGVVGLGGWHAPALARLWGAEAGASLSAVSVTLGGTPAAGWSPVALAGVLDRSPAVLGEALSDVVPAGASAVIVPAVLGVSRTAEVAAAASEACGAPVVEALGVPPSLPGWRLDRAFLAVLAAAGVAVIGGRAMGCRMEGGRVGSVRVRGRDAAERSVAAAAMVLATGKFLAGGIGGDPMGGAAELREAVLGLPAPAERFGERIPEAEPLAVTDVDRTDRQPLLNAGVRLDPSGLVLGDGGAVAASNVWAAGTVRAGVAAASFGLGHAASEGWTAGERAAAAAGRGGA